MGESKGSFLRMVLAVIGVVVLFAIFPTIMTGLATLLTTSGIGSFIALTTIIGISPTVLILGLTTLAGWQYIKGYKQAAISDTSGLLRMVMGVLEIILFITLFASIISSSYTLYLTANTTWIAFGVVMSIVPTILFIGGIFAGVATGVSGIRARMRRRAAA